MVLALGVHPSAGVAGAYSPRQYLRGRASLPDRAANSNDHNRHTTYRHRSRCHNASCDSPATNRRGHSDHDGDTIPASRHYSCHPGSGSRPDCRDDSRAKAGVRYLGATQVAPTPPNSGRNGQPQFLPARHVAF